MPNYLVGWCGQIRHALAKSRNDACSSCFGFVNSKMVVHTLSHRPTEMPATTMDKIQSEMRAEMKRLEARRENGL